MCPAPVAGDRAQRCGGSEGSQVVLLQLESEHRGMRLGGSNASACGLREATHQAKPEAQCRSFQRAIPFTRIYIRRQHFHAMAASVLHELRRRIKAHRLAVEERRAESRRVVALE